MPSFGNTSKAKLATAHEDLQKIFNEAIKQFDFSVIFGHRTPEEQFELFKKGRSLNIDGEWIITDKSKVVTYLDGYEKKSKHNYLPSHAVDVWLYPIDWSKTEEMNHFAGFVLGLAQSMYDKGEIKNKIEWGGNWESFRDMPHFQLKSSNNG